MIRQDYILRLVAEMTQVLLRVVSLRHRQEYEQALREVEEALRRVRGDSPGEPPPASLEEWFALCQKHEHAASGLLGAVAGLLREQGELFASRGRLEEAQRARCLALGMFLENLLTGRTYVSGELLGTVETLFTQTWGQPLPAAVQQRLLQYFEARGRYGTAEDVLFSWAETGDPAALREGLAFYDRLLRLNNAELEQGALPRAEVESGKAALSRLR